MREREREGERRWREGEIEIKDAKYYILGVHIGISMLLDWFAGGRW